MNTLRDWTIINLVWSAILGLASGRLYFLFRQWEKRIEKRNRWLAEQQRKQRQL